LATKPRLRSPEAEIALARRPGGTFGEAALSLYGAAGRIGLPVAGAFLAWRARHGKEDASRRGERLGRAALKRPAGPLIWLHAASVGETVAAAPLIRRLRARGPTVLLTTGTVTAADVAARRLGEAMIHQFAPIDCPATVRHFLDHWRPDLALFAESELWPTTLKALGSRSLPLIVISARMSERSFRSWRAFPSLARAVVGRVELFLAQTLVDAERLRQLGAHRVDVCGNLKFDVPPPAADEAAVAQMRSAIGDRSVLVAASTHPGEEPAVIAAHAELARRGVQLVTVIAPRHPARGEEIADEIDAAGLRLRRRSLGEQIGEDTDIYLADTIGEMGLWYRLGDAAFLGGSLVPHGGQNPIEPAKLLVPVLHGTHVDNFRDVYDALTAAKAVIAVHDSTTLADAVRRLMADPVERDRMAREARACVERFTGALERTVEALQPYIETLLNEDNAATRA
jgi:3-deoxy-D-manno-octulosonic-acid transferase